MAEELWSEEDLRIILKRYESDLREAGKARITIATLVEPVERFVNWLTGNQPPLVETTGQTSVGTLEPTAEPTLAGPGNPPPEASRGRRSRYDGLRAHLATQTEDKVQLTFAQIEGLIEGGLPPSARRYRPWWANERGGTHVHARAWLDAGRLTTNVNLNAQTVEFVKERGPT
jgi:hypothetical protein